MFKRHPKSLKLAHFFPAAFTVGIGGAVALAVLGFPWLAAAYGVYFVAILLQATWQYRSVRIGGLSVLASAIQLTSYGLGFIKAVWRRLVLRGDEFAAFEKNFYK